MMELVLHQIRSQIQQTPSHDKSSSRNLGFDIRMFAGQPKGAPDGLYFREVGSIALADSSSLSRAGANRVRRTVLFHSGQKVITAIRGKLRSQP